MAINEKNLGRALDDEELEGATGGFDPGMDNLTMTKGIGGQTKGMGGQTKGMGGQTKNLNNQSKGLGSQTKGKGDNGGNNR